MSALALAVEEFEPGYGVFELFGHYVVYGPGTEYPAVPLSPPLKSERALLDWLTGEHPEAPMPGGWPGIGEEAARALLRLGWVPASTQPAGAGHEGAPGPVNTPSEVHVNAR